MRNEYKNIRILPKDKGINGNSMTASQNQKILKSNREVNIQNTFSSDKGRNGNNSTCNTRH